eukprot:362984-Chlamydomonas_euryale.AAC.6
MGLGNGADVLTLDGESPQQPSVDLWGATGGGAPADADVDSDEELTGVIDVMSSSDVIARIEEVVASLVEAVVEGGSARTIEKP